MKNIIVGLGNPGEEYKNTRHNAGWLMLESVHAQKGFSTWANDRDCGARVSKGTIEGRESVLAMPQSFMNQSGKSVHCLIKREHAPRFILVHDDIDLPRGTLRISFGRGSGGHRGVESVAAALGGTYDFTRIRLGVSPIDTTGAIQKPTGEEAVEKFVLGTISSKEKEALLALVPVVCEALSLITEKGVEEAMNRFN